MPPSKGPVGSDDPDRIVDAFIEGLPPAALWPRGELGAHLAALVAGARAAWPGVSVDAAKFARYLAERSHPGCACPADLVSLHVADLYLACGSVAGDPTALRVLNESFVTPLAADLARNTVLGPWADEAQQALRVRLLVGHDGELPRLAGYRGTGPLAAWLRLTLTRLALNLHNAASRETTLDEDMLRAASPSERDPEMQYFRQHFRDVVLDATRAAFEALSAQERTILRMHFLDGLSAGDVGAMFEMSGRTVQRRIADTRRQILRDVRKRLSERVGLNPSQMDTLMRLVQSDLHLSLRHILT